MEISKVVFDIYERYKDDPLKAHKRDDETEATWQQRICDDPGATGTVTLPQETRDFLRGLKPGQTKEEWEATFQVNLQIHRRGAGMLSIITPRATDSSIPVGDQIEKESEQPRNARAGTVVIQLTDKQFDKLLGVAKETQESQNRSLCGPMQRTQSNIFATGGEMTCMSTEVKTTSQEVGEAKNLNEAFDDIATRFENMADGFNNMADRLERMANGFERMAVGFDNMAISITKLCDTLNPAIEALTASVETQKAAKHGQQLNSPIERYIADKEDNTGR